MTSETTTPIRTQADAIALIEETVKFYGENPKERRAVKLYTCAYDTGGGAQCAVGRCLIDASDLERKVGGDRVDGALSHLGLASLDPLLKPEYRGYPLRLWCKLQALHDLTDNWNMVGLSLTGEERVEEFKQWVRSDSGLPD